jgi:hypothetical protein
MKLPICKVLIRNLKLYLPLVLDSSVYYVNNRKRNEFLFLCVRDDHFDSRKLILTVECSGTAKPGTNMSTATSLIR